MDSYVDQLVEWHGFLDTLARAMKESVYAICAQLVDELDGVLSFEKWAAAKEARPLGKLPIAAAHGKIAEAVMQSLGMEGRLVVSPLESNELSFGWMGSAAINGVGVGVSGLPQQHDQLIALCTLYHAAIDPTLHLHHVGRRFQSEIEYGEANASLSGGMARPTPDHKSTYFRSPTETWYTENQLFYDPAFRDDCRHLDFVVNKPIHFLHWVATVFGQDPTYFSDVGATDPIGVVTITGVSKRLGTTKLAVMARNTWWNVEDD